MKCFSCQSDSPAHAKFCSNCGRDFRPKNRVDPELHRAKLETARAESLSAYSKIKSKKLKACFLFSIVFLAAVLVIGRSELRVGSSIPIITFIIFIAGVVLISWIWRFSEKNYYSIPNSKTPEGEHRCIWCGNRGIWKQGQYKTNLTHCNCSKCKAYLYTE